LGYERWANLAPSVSELQTFGNAEVSQDSTLQIKLVGIDGSIKYEMTYTPLPESPKGMSGASKTVISAISALSTVAWVLLVSLD
jgi:hypothetical protein